MASANLITFGDQCPPNPCQPCGCDLFEYAAVLSGPFFAPLAIDFSVPPAQLPIVPWLTKTIHIDWVPNGNTQHFIYDCVININPLTNDVSITDSGDPNGYGALIDLIGAQFPGVTFAPDSITVNVPSSFAESMTASITLSNPWDRGAIQSAIDTLLQQLTWDQVKVYLAQFNADPVLNPLGKANFCALCVNWQNHYQFGNGNVTDASPPWHDDGNYTVLIGAFFQAPLPRNGVNNVGLFDANNHMIAPYQNVIGAQKLQVNLLEQVFGTSEAGNTLLSIPALIYEIVPPSGLTETDFAFLASKLLVNVTGNYCDKAAVQAFQGGAPISTSSSQVNVGLVRGTEIQRLPFVWLDVDSWQWIFHEYDRGTC
jgi:hypothetical protein